MYGFPITIDKTKVGGPLANFAYYFSELTATIPAGFWGHVADSVSGLDVRFYDSAWRELRREVVFFDVVNSLIECHVQLPPISGAADPVIFCCYGGATRPNDTRVWIDAGGTLVCHLHNTGADSTGRMVINSVTASPADARLHRGYSFAGNNVDVVDLGGPRVFNHPPFTFSAWAYPTGLTPGETAGCIVNDVEWCILMLDDGTAFPPNGGWAIGFYDWLGDMQWHGVATQNSPASQFNAWKLIHGVYTGSAWLIYVNGQYVNGSNYVKDFASAQEAIVGRFEGGDSQWHYGWKGKLDEVRIYNEAKSADWIATEYANQNDPGTFAACGGELEFPPVGGGFLPLFLNH